MVYVVFNWQKNNGETHEWFVVQYPTGVIISVMVRIRLSLKGQVKDDDEWDFNPYLSFGLMVVN
jgi:hypothetical protein